jgi:peptidoglycan/xylan/chitin deacetylase (PgdA/CDA1 family)
LLLACLLTLIKLFVEDCVHFSFREVRRLAAPLCGGVLIMLLSGCNRSGAPEPTAAAISPAQAAPIARPRPTPKPDPMIAVRARQQIPNWAKSRVLLRVPVKPGDKVFALTFDDGPWPEYTRQILQILKDNDVKATFFMVGQELSRRPEIGREVRDAGHAVGSHSWDHPARPRDPVGQIQRTDAVIKKQLGFAPTIFRPPYGILLNGMARQARKEGQAVLIWSADCADWKRPGSDHIARMIIGQASPGGIALMHDGGGNRSQTVAALPTIIRELRERGYRFVTIPELLKLRYIAPPRPKKPAAKKSVQKKP